VPEKEIAAVGRDREPLTSVALELRQEETVAAEHQAAGELASPSQGKTADTDVPHTVCPDPGAGNQVDGGGCQSDTAETFHVEPPPTDPEAG
jgi:hypothetical protein